MSVAKLERGIKEIWIVWRDVTPGCYHSSYQTYSDYWAAKAHFERNKNKNVQLAKYVLVFEQRIDSQ